jgi:hypothetical protein
MLMNDNGDGPATTASFSLLMLLGTKGRQYSLAELRGFSRGGFRDVMSTPTCSYYSVVSARNPAMGRRRDGFALRSCSRAVLPAVAAAETTQRTPHPPAPDTAVIARRHGADLEATGLVLRSRAPRSRLAGTARRQRRLRPTSRQRMPPVGAGTLGGRVCRNRGPCSR